MDFGTLKSRIQALIGRAPADVCYELVTSDINRELRLRFMAATTTIAESATVALPADFLQVISLYRDVDPRTILHPLPPQTIHRIHESSGTPRFYSIEDGQLRLSPSPNGSENLVLRYYAKLPDLAANEDVNDILTNYPNVYIYGALAHHAVLTKDEMGVQTWTAAYRDAKTQANADDRKYRQGATPTNPIPRAWA
jgi:hypothetical protein